MQDTDKPLGKTSATTDTVTEVRMMSTGDAVLNIAAIFGLTLLALILSLTTGIIGAAIGVHVIYGFLGLGNGDDVPMALGFIIGAASLLIMIFIRIFAKGPKNLIFFRQGITGGGALFYLFLGLISLIGVLIICSLSAVFFGWLYLLISPMGSPAWGAVPGFHVPIFGILILIKKGHLKQFIPSIQTR